METSEGARPAGGLKGALARLAESALGLLRTRAELAGVELVEERERLVLRLALLVAGIVVLAFAALFIGVFIIALFWESHPLGAIASVALVYALAGALLIAKSRTLGREAPPPFSATLAEFEKDRARIQRAAQDATGHPP
jgi:uncharacterized membrane protein YqjE